VTGNNAPLTTVYEPGSIMKLVTMSGIIEDGVLAPDAEIDVPDALPVGDHVFTEYKPHGLGSWPLGDVIRRSSNTGTIKLAQMLGEERLEHWFREFGFGERTGIGFPDEAAGVVHPAEDWSATSIGSMPIGQGISVTPVQMLAAYNTIANDGVQVPLRIIDGQIDEHGVLHRTDEREPRRVVSPSTSAVLTDMLRSVVFDGTGTRAEVPGYPAAGKTGTALKPYGGGYTGPDGIAHYMGSFVGFAPASDPGLSMIVIIDDPRSGLYTGGLVAAPVFSELGQFALRRLAVPSVLAAPDPASAGGVELAAGPSAKVRALPAAPPEQLDLDGEAVEVAAAEGTAPPESAGR
jgi:cell division protein FtsI (penicillin-binding protein 3)